MTSSFSIFDFAVYWSGLLQELAQSHMYGVLIVKGDARKGNYARYSAKSLPFSIVGLGWKAAMDR